MAEVGRRKPKSQAFNAQEFKAGRRLSAQVAAGWKVNRDFSAADFCDRIEALAPKGLPDIAAGKECQDFQRAEPAHGDQDQFPARF